MHWFRITNTKIICLETGHELSLNHGTKGCWGIHSTAFQGFIKIFETKDENEALEEFTNFIKRLNVMKYEKEKAQKGYKITETKEETIT